MIDWNCDVNTINHGSELVIDSFLKHAESGPNLHLVLIPDDFQAFIRTLPEQGHCHAHESLGGEDPLRKELTASTSNRECMRL